MRKHCHSWGMFYSHMQKPSEKVNSITESSFDMLLTHCLLAMDGWLKPALWGKSLRLQQPWISKMRELSNVAGRVEITTDDAVGKMRHLERPNTRWWTGPCLTFLDALLAIKMKISAHYLLSKHNNDPKALRCLAPFTDDRKAFLQSDVLKDVGLLIWETGTVSTVTEETRVSCTQFRTVLLIILLAQTSVPEEETELDTRKDLCK